MKERGAGDSTGRKLSGREWELVPHTTYRKALDWTRRKGPIIIVLAIVMFLAFLYVSLGLTPEISDTVDSYPYVTKCEVVHPEDLDRDDG